MVPVPSKAGNPGLVWVWFLSKQYRNTGSGFVSENWTWFRVTWSEVDG
jgi:hypothetical protein